MNSREILADVLAGNISMTTAAPALRTALQKESPLIYYLENPDGTYNAMAIEGTGFKLSDLFTKPTYKNLTKAEFQDLTKYGKMFGFSNA